MDGFLWRCENELSVSPGLRWTIEYSQESGLADAQAMTILPAFLVREGHRSLEVMALSAVMHCWGLIFFQGILIRR